MQQHHVILLFFFFLFSCKEEQKPVTVIREQKIDYAKLLLTPQPYYSLVGSLEMNEGILKDSKVKSYTATFSLLDTNKKAYRLQYKNCKPSLNEIVFADMKINGKKMDTIQSKKMLTKTSTENKYFLKSINAQKKSSYLLIEKLNTQQQVTQVTRTNQDNKKVDIENFVYTNECISRKDYVDLGKGMYIYNTNKFPISFVFINPKGDTNLAYKQRLQNNHIIVQYYKGSHEVFDYTYNEYNELVDIMWSERKKMKVHIVFTYTQNHLVKTRTIMSNLKAFPSCKTVYDYQVE